GLVEGAWKHWSRVWEVDYEFLKSRFDSKQIMETPGIPLTRWFDAVTLPKDQVAQKDNVRAVFVQGHASNSITRIPESLNGLKALELLVIADPHPTTWASLSVEAGRKDGVYILPVATQFECKGSRVASNRSLQWGEQIVKPVFESKDDLEVIYLMAKKFGFADKLFKNIKVENNLPEAEDVLREMNRGSWSTGYCGQSPERLKAHMKNQAKFDMLTMRAPKDDPEVGGDYYGLPWPCWGSPEVKHPGTPLLYNTNLAVMDGGGTFRPRFGVEREDKLPAGPTRKVSQVAKYPTRPDAKQFRVPNIGFSVQKAAVEKGIAKQFPLILSSGRLVEYEGGGEETRTNPWLAELQQDMFIEISPADAAERGIKDGGWVWVTGAESNSKAKMKALVTERVGKGVAWMPFHFGGWFAGKDLRDAYPKGTDPIVLGESANTITTYGYDPATGMQEPKVTLCQIAAA